MMAEKVDVTAYLAADSWYARNVLQGILRYANEQPGWNLFAPDEFELSRGNLPANWKERGRIVCASDARLTRKFTKSRIPTVNVSAGHSLDRIPSVVLDNRLIGKLAAECFLDLGFLNFAYFGAKEFLFSSLRRDGFVSRLEEAGFNCAEHIRLYSAGPEDSGKWQKIAERWLGELTKPIALMAYTDMLAWSAMKACQQLGIAVPDEVAIIGSGNDPLFVHGISPPLSGVEEQPDRIGYRAADLLDRLMKGESPPGKPILIPPMGIATRESSDVVAVEDQEVAKAMRFIRNHATEQISVEDVIEELVISRRSLELRFKKHIGRPPGAEIIRTQLAEAKRLLAQTNFPIKKVATRSGFSTIGYFCRAFRREFDTTPSQYRNQLQMA